ncbi:MAG: arylesterase [Endozoicomonas sp.]
MALLINKTMPFIKIPFTLKRRFIYLAFVSLLTLSFLTSAQAADNKLLLFGDSLSAAYGLTDVSKGWPRLLQDKIRQQQYKWRIINVSISGETTAGGLSRFAKALERHNPDLVLLELGANDGLRGTSLTALRNNLDQMLRLADERRIKTILFEMRIPPNYGSVYTKGFTETFHELGRKWDIPVQPFFLEGVAGNRSLNQADGIHPNEAAQPRLLANIWPTLEPLLKGE